MQSSFFWFNGTENTEPTFIGNLNPIRWKSLYYDVESGLYYIDGRYYSPETRQFLSSLPSPWGASCPLRKALIMLFRDEVSKRIGIAFAVPENNIYLTLFEKGRDRLLPFFLAFPLGGRGTACGG